MRAIAGRVLGCVLAALALIAALDSLAERGHADTAQRAVVVVDITGSVAVVRKGAETPVEASVGMELFPGDKVTGAAGSDVTVFDDASGTTRVPLGPGLPPLFVGVKPANADVGAKPGLISGLAKSLADVFGSEQEARKRDREVGSVEAGMIMARLSERQAAPGAENYAQQAPAAPVAPAAARVAEESDKLQTALAAEPADAKGALKAKVPAKREEPAPAANGADLDAEGGAAPQGVAAQKPAAPALRPAPPATDAVSSDAPADAGAGAAASAPAPADAAAGTGARRARTMAPAPAPQREIVTRKNVAAGASSLSEGRPPVAQPSASGAVQAAPADEAADLEPSAGAAKDGLVLRGVDGPWSSPDLIAALGAQKLSVPLARAKTISVKGAVPLGTVVRSGKTALELADGTPVKSATEDLKDGTRVRLYAYSGKHRWTIELEIASRAEWEGVIKVLKPLTDAVPNALVVAAKLLERRGYPIAAYIIEKRALAQLARKPASARRIPEAEALRMGTLIGDWKGLAALQENQPGK